MGQNKPLLQLCTRYLVIEFICWKETNLMIKSKEVEIVKEVKTCVILCGDVFDLCTKVQWAPHIEGERPSSMHKHLFQKCQSISIPNLRIMDSRWCLNGGQHVCIDSIL